MIETKNAIIANAKITIEMGFLDIWLKLNYDYGEGSQGFGGYVLYTPKSKDKLKSIAGYFIWKIMEIAEVNEWSDIKGKTIRVKAEYNKVHEIGHITKNIWFNPSKELE